MIDPMFGVHTLPTVLLVHAAAVPTPGMIVVRLKVTRPAAVLKVANPGIFVGPTIGGDTFSIVPPVSPANEPVFVPPTAKGFVTFAPVRLKKRPELFTVTPPAATFAILAVLPLVRGVAKAGVIEINALTTDIIRKESPCRILNDCTSSGIGVKVNRPPHGDMSLAPIYMTSTANRSFRFKEIKIKRARCEIAYVSNENPCAGANWPSSNTSCRKI